MPIIWDRQGRYGREDDHRIATGQGITTARRQGVGCNGPGVENTPSIRQVRDETVPPRRKRPLLDNGRGESNECSHSISTVPMPHATTPLHPGRVKASTKQPYQDTMYHRSQAAGTTIPPPSQLGDSTDGNERTVTTITTARFTTLVQRPEKN